MKPTLLAAPIALCLLAPAIATAQSSAPTCKQTKIISSQSPTATTTSMADSSSDMGNTGSGASSASLGTGPTDKTGVETPCAPTTTGHGATGALPETSPKPSN